MIVSPLAPESTGRFAPRRPHSTEIERVAQAVRSVLDEARAGGADGSELHVERLLSLRHAEALGAGTRAVRLAVGTVVTPLARDLLKRRGISLHYVPVSEILHSQQVGEWGFVIESRSGVSRALRRALLDGPDAWRERESLRDVVDWVVERGGRGALVVTDEASVAVWRACQVPGIRAAAAETCDALSRAARRLGVNVLVVEPAGKSVSWLRQLALTLRRCGPPVVPEAFEEGLSCGSPR